MATRSPLSLDKTCRPETRIRCLCRGQGKAQRRTTCHVWARPAFIAQMQAAEQGKAPDIPGVDMAALMLALVKSVRPEDTTPLDHFNEVLAANKLQRVEEV